MVDIDLGKMVDILGKWQTFREKRAYILNITGTYQPDIEWLLVAPSILQPNHRFFGKKLLSFG